MRQNGLDAVESVRRYLESTSWRAEAIPDRHAFRARVEDEVCPRIYYFQIIVELEQFLFYVAPVLTLLPEMLPDVAEFVARANFGMRIGNFEVDYEKLGVCFRSSINFQGVPLSGALVEGAVGPAIEAYETYFPGLAEVVAGIAGPSEAIRKIERGE